MNKWLWIVVFLAQAHFAASYIAPTKPGLGLFNYVWPWATGDHGLLGTHPNLVGIALGGSAAVASLLAALAVLGLWLPHDSWRVLASVGAALSLVLMVGYLTSTKLLPILLDIAVLVAIWVYQILVKSA